MDTATQKLLQLVPLAYFRLQAVSDRLHAPRRLTTGLRGLLLSLEELGPTSAARLADMRPVSRQAIHKMAEQLLERRLVRQVDNPSDKRAPLLALTEKGRDEIARARAVEAPQIAQLFQGMTRREIEDAVRVLEAVCERLMPVAGERQARGRAA